jgi:predicted nucleic acid-binding Zn ribbon protein
MRVKQSRRKPSRPCTICGLFFRPVRIGARVCSNTCQKRRRRGAAELAYLDQLPPDEARKHQRLHAAIADAIEVAGWASSARREGRAARRGMPKVKRIRVRRSS